MHTAAVVSQTASTYRTPASMDPLLKAQPLVQLLKLMRQRAEGLFKIESVKLPEIVVDMASRTAYFEPEQGVTRASGDIIVSARAVNQLPSWAHSAQNMPLNHLIWAAAESAAPPSYGVGQRFALAKMPVLTYGPNYRHFVRMAALCLTHGHTH